ncbi:MauE/DoxX family redox-associated membrane protein [Thermodesulfobacteriota bacterium]
MKSSREIIFFNSWIELIFRWVLGVSFIYASCNKIIDPEHFTKIIYGYYLFPGYSINLIAIVLPFFELFSGLFLILGVYPRSAALIINGMLLAFIIAVSINLVRGQQFDCGCFSFDDVGYTYSALQLLVRDVIFFILGTQVLFYGRRRKWCIRQTGGLLKTISP